MKKIITYLLVLTSLAANGQIVNKFRDSSWFKSGVRFDSTLVFSKGAGNGKVWMSNANGTGSWQTINTTGVSQQVLNDSMTTVRGLIPDTSNFATKTALKDTSLLLRGLIPDVSGYATKTALNDSVTTLRNIRKVDTIYRNAGGDSIVYLVNSVRRSILDANTDAQTLSVGTNTLTISGGNTVNLNRKVDSSTLALNVGRDSLVFTSIINGTTYRNAVRDSSIATPTLTFAKSATRDSFVLTYNGSRTALVDSFSRARKVDTIYRTAGKDSIIFTVNNVRYAVKDSLGGSAGWSLTGNAGTSGYPSNFIGTTDNRDVIFKRNNAYIFALGANGIFVGINTSDNKYIEVDGSTTGNPATGYSYIGYGGFQTYTANEIGFSHFNGVSKYMGIGVGTDGITRIKTGSSSGIATAIYINAAYGGDGNVGIGASPTASAKLSVTSTSSGFLPPVMTSTQRDAISTPATGLMIFCSDCTATDASTGVTQTYNGSTWKNFW